MSITTGLTAVEALRKAKEEGGFVRPKSLGSWRWHWDEKGREFLAAFHLEETGQWKLAVDMYDDDNVNPIHILEPWEHHKTADTL